ncbi:MAG: hypothetical protein GY810_04265 [Aureispira sp.]|nr:hypothetical protein [Aureispira sp.]
MRRKKIDIPPLDRFELAKVELQEEFSVQEKLLWGEQIDLPTTGAGCMALLTGLFTLPGLFLVLAGLINLYLPPLLAGLVWSGITVSLTSFFVRYKKKLNIVLAENFLVFKEGRDTIKLPLEQIQEISINGYSSDTKVGDLALIVRTKKLNTETYKFKVENRRYNLEKVSNAREIKRKITEAKEKLLLINPKAINKIELEGRDKDLLT